MEQQLEYSLERQNEWFVENLKNESQNIDALVAEVFREIPENSVIKQLEIDRDARNLISKAIEGIFRAVILDHADIFSSRAEVITLADEEENLEKNLVDIFGLYRGKTNSEQFAKTCKEVFNHAGVILELATDGSPQHLRKSIAKQVVKEVSLTATEVMKNHRGDYLCKIAKSCAQRDSLLRH